MYKRSSNHYCEDLGLGVSPLTSYATGRGHSSLDCRPGGTYGIDKSAAAGGRGCRRQTRGTGRPSLLMSRALALLLSLSSLALFLGFISSIHAYVGSRLWGVVITGPSMNLLLHNHFITQINWKKNPAKQKTAQLLPSPPYLLPLPTYPPIPHTPPIRLRAFRLCKTLVLTLNPQNPSVKSIWILLCFHNHIKKKNLVTIPVSTSIVSWSL